MQESFICRFSNSELRVCAFCPFLRRLASSRTTGLAETKEEARTAKKAKIKKAMIDEYIIDDNQVVQKIVSSRLE